ncbi:MAG TPA: alkaline phosphatase family protein [Kofleriaceae bacterium]|nr:alkaline phosphatase family protein [Kofleriaceae bacterium]
MRVTVGLLAVAFAASACSVDTSGNVKGQACRALTATSPATAALESPFQGTVFTIVIENKSRAQLLEGTAAPYLKSLAHQYTIANGYTDARVHPSEPNYIWMVSGQNFGILDDGEPAEHHIASTSHLADQLEGVGRTWKTYQESMGEPCKIVNDGKYAPKHNPFVFFDDVVGWNGKTPLRQQRCKDHVVDYSELEKDLANDTVPDYVFITPNLINDMHDGTIAQGDAWLAREVPKILASKAWQNGGVLIITADEGEGRSATDWSQEDDPPFVVVSPLAKKGYVSNTPYDTSSFLKTVQAIEGVEPLPCGTAASADAPTMDDLFTVPLPAMLPPAGA